METTTLIDKKLKTEVLTALKNLSISASDFEQNFEGDLYSTADTTKHIETENYNIDIQLVETVKWQSYDYYELDALDIKSLSITDEYSNQFENEFTDEEILNALNY